MTVLTMPKKIELADDTPAKATFITERALTFTVANTGGIGILTVYGLLNNAITAPSVVAVAVILGLLVTALGTPWQLPSGSLFGDGEKWRNFFIHVVIGLFNTALLAVALWGSVVAIEAGLT